MKVIGHRGAAALAPENTLISFSSAIEAGAHAVECDARLTADGEVVLMHDDEVSRTTDGRGFVSEMTLHQVRALDAAATWEGRWGERVPVPTLGELLELVGGRIAVVIELKADWDHRGFRSAEQVARVVAPVVAGRSGVVVSSFDPVAVAVARAIAPSTMTALSILRGFSITDGIESARASGHGQIHPAQEGVDAEVVTAAHDAGLQVCCWTVDDVVRARELATVGVDAVFSDDPAAMVIALA